MKKLLLIALLMMGCDNSTEPAVDEQRPEPSEICNNIISDVDGSIVSCDEDCELYSDVCYYSNDLDVLQDLIDLNQSLSGEIPQNIGYQEWTDGRLTYLNLYSHQLTILPESIGNLSSLVYLGLYNNQLTTLPESICNLPVYSYITVVNNKLCEEYQYDCINYLGEQDKSNCDCAGITGGTAELDNCGVCDSDETNDCVQDECGVWGGSGVLDEYGGDGSTCVYLLGEYYSIENTTELNLNNIGLSGEIPAEIGQLTNLTSLNLGDNEFTGSIPSWMGQLANLNVLWLYSNQFTGSIPSWIGQLTNLTILGLQNNQLTGAIPSEIGNLTNLTYLNLQWNQLTGDIPVEICNQGDSTPSLTLNKLCPPYPSCLSEDDIGTQNTSDCAYCEDNTDDPYCDDE